MLKVIKKAKEFTMTLEQRLGCMATLTIIDCSESTVYKSITSSHPYAKYAVAANLKDSCTHLTSIHQDILDFLGENIW